jgi:hypothetical protein
MFLLLLRPTLLFKISFWIYMMFICYFKCTLIIKSWLSFVLTILCFEFFSAGNSNILRITPKNINLARSKNRMKLESLGRLRNWVIWLIIGYFLLLIINLVKLFPLIKLGHIIKFYGYNIIR